jgi:aminopeptidase N
MFRTTLPIAASLTLLTAGCRAAPAPQDAASATDVVERGRAALHAGDTAALRALGEKPETLSWLAHRTGPGGPRWQLHLLRSPRTGTANRPPDPVLVFSKFQPVQTTSDHIHRLVKTPAGWRIGAEIPDNDPLGYRVRDHHLRVRFDLPKSATFITDDVRIERTTAPAGQPFFLRLSANLKVDSIARNGAPFTAATHVPGVIWVSPPPGEKGLTLRFTYSGTFTEPGMDTYVNPREVFLNSYWYPHVARLPATATVEAEVPEGWTAVGQGEPKGTEKTASGTRFRWRNDLPVSFFSLVAGKYTVTNRTVNGKTLTTYQLEPSAEDAARTLDRIERVMPVFEKAFGPYPYTRYAVVQSLGPFPGALEAYSFSTSAGRRFFAVDHELAHSWWGGVVPNSYTRSLWNEAFASYSEGFAARQLASPPPGRASAGLHRAPDLGRRYQTSYPVPVAQSFDTENSAHNSAGYGKGAIVLAMLEDELGTETMVRALRAFVADHPRGDAADWPDFERAVKKVSGKDYRWFFSQWLERPGAPVVKLANAKVEKQGAEWVAMAEIVQEGRPYRLNLPVLLETSGEPIRVVVSAQERITKVRLVTRAEPRVLRLDPLGSVLLSGAAGENPFEVRF